MIPSTNEYIRRWCSFADYRDTLQLLWALRPYFSRARTRQSHTPKPKLPSAVVSTRQPFIFTQSSTPLLVAIQNLDLSESLQIRARRAVVTARMSHALTDTTGTTLSHYAHLTFQCWSNYKLNIYFRAALHCVTSSALWTSRCPLS